MTRIREATAEDAPAIRNVLDAAFGGTDESTLVDHLCNDGLTEVSLVAVEDGEIVGIIVFSTLEITDLDRKTPIRAVSLAPVAVAPTHQRLGIGTALINQGIEKCKELGIEAIVVVGHEAYYPRFGFSAQIGECLKSPFSGQFFMVLPIIGGIFYGFSGMVIYPDAFGAFSQQ